MAEESGERVSYESVRRYLRRHCLPAPSAHNHKSGSGIPSEKKTIEAIRDALPGHNVFCYADETDLSWQPTLQPMWAPIGQQIMIPTPGVPRKRYGIGAVSYHTGEVVALVQTRKRRSEVAELLEQLLARHPTETIYIAWDHRPRPIGTDRSTTCSAPPPVSWCSFTFQPTVHG